MTDSRLYDLTATELTRLVQQRELTATTVTEAFLDRIATHNPAINAIVTLVPEMAMAQAKALDARIAQGEQPGPLAGLPIAHKDLTETAGIRTTFGSPRFRDYVPDQSSLLVTRIQAAGGITTGKTNTPEFGAGSHTFNTLFGTTLNPWHTGKSAGGSSGGAAAALAARLLPLADGSDMGGSLRNPAAFCHVVGFRTTPGCVPNYPTDLAWNTLPIVGPMARNVQDCALFLSAISGADSRDPLSLGRGPLNCIPETEPDIRGVRIALSPDFHGQIPFDAEIPTVVERAGKHFEALGCRVSHACPDFTGADEAFKIHRAWSMAARHGEALQRERHLYKETLAWNIEQGLKLGPADLTRAEQLKSQLHLRMSNFFEDYDYLLVPTTQVLPFEASEEYPRVIAGVAMETYIDWMKSCYYLSNLICPVISVPAGFSREGLPIGLQIVGRPMDEAGVLRMAQALEHATGFSRLRPG